MAVTFTAGSSRRWCSVSRASAGENPLAVDAFLVKWDLTLAYAIEPVTSSGEENQGRSSESHSNCPFLAQENLVRMAQDNIGRRSLGTTRYSKLCFPGTDLPSTSEGTPFNCLEFEQSLLKDRGFSPNFIDTLLKSRKQMTTKIYSRTWRKFLASSDFNIKEGVPMVTRVNIGLLSAALRLVTRCLPWLPASLVAGERVSKPDIVIFPLANWKPSKQFIQAEDAGPEVNHVYELANLGPSSISHGVLTLSCPIVHNQEQTMYVMNYSVQGLGNCTTSQPLNPFQLQYSSAEQNPSGHHIERRDTSRVSAGGSLLLKCAPPHSDCFYLRCDVGPLEKLRRAILKVHFRVWANTFVQNENQGFALQCDVAYQIHRLPYKILPESYPQGTHHVNTTIHWLKPESSYGVPLWIIILAILIGLLLLALLIYVLYKLGFFKRSLPYGTAMEKAELKPQAASEA
ncbi:unnamed protein product [Ranitomeya imitator]|uniref:Integrin alpha third immunoglobulin-like domain-containing protein n=1 Tax=Ranitomeya imitator TaxID=111125 RepID=A0ABN9M626_9NEOB|nr:unnamed protein product [Ranitomeya imitator]